MRQRACTRDMRSVTVKLHLPVLVTMAKESARRIHGVSGRCDFLPRKISSRLFSRRIVLAPTCQIQPERAILEKQNKTTTELKSVQENLEELLGSLTR
ncbi:hypothetical protein KM043_010095 [Ampulex compressa]|nr:hypothetical protein KM043_010095 [Ampulex compressa]